MLYTCVNNSHIYSPPARTITSMSSDPLCTGAASCAAPEIQLRSDRLIMKDKEIVPPSPSLSFPSTAISSLLLPKPNRLLHSPQQLLLQRIKALIRRQIQPIETRMTLRQLRLLPRLLNGEPPGPVTTLQILEPIDRDPTGSGRELQESRLLLGIPGSDALPEVLDHDVGFRVATVISVFLPVIHVDVCYAADEELEFALVEDVDQVCGDEFVEAGDEGVELFFDALLDAPFGDQSAQLVNIVCSSSKVAGTYSTYSFLFSFVTSMSFPPGFNSTVTFSPNLSSSTEKVL